MAPLSQAAQSLWGKLPRESGDMWLPLFMHMRDAAETAKLLWKYWLSHGLKAFLAPFVSGDGRFFVFLAAAHDLGKASPLFQLGPRRFASPVLATVQGRIRDQGLNLAAIAGNSVLHHSLISQAMLEQRGAAREFAVILGGHHGTPPSYGECNAACGAAAYPNHTGFRDAAWRKAQDELYQYAVELAGIEGHPLPVPSVEAQALLSGLVIMADWIASSGDLFPLLSFDAPPIWDKERAGAAWKELQLPLPVEFMTVDQYAACDLYNDRFELRTPRPVQAAALEMARNIGEPGICIMEAPMGEGKTEAALAAAEIFLSKTGRSGLYFALPTQATSDGLFPRISSWSRKVGLSGEERSIVLAHGKSRFNEEYQGIRRAGPGGGTQIFRAEVGEEDEEGEENLIVHSWFTGRKKSLLADFVVGTVDHVLMGALRQKHLALRHLGLADKVVIIDECHAYDAYMSSYLYRMLAWLGQYKTPVIVLSATLPAASRMKLVEAYTGKNFTPSSVADPIADALFGPSPSPVAPPDWAVSRDYPLLTWTDGGATLQVSPPASGRRTKILLERLADENMPDTLEALLTDSGCAGIIVNTVARAQSMARRLAERFGNEAVLLVHARFLAAERVRKERELRDQLGPKGKRPETPFLVVGTQVLEQSLDVDFDLMITDVCPMDLLLQRMGRLHRHERPRPPKLAQAKCFITGFTDNGFESGTECIYGAYLLLRTAHVLPGTLTLPDDIPGLVQNAYAEDDPDIPHDRYAAAKGRQRLLAQNKEQRAKAFQLCGPEDRPSLVGWLDTSITERDDPSGRRAEASVRDSVDSLEVIVIQRAVGGVLRILPWLEKCGGRAIPDTLDDELADAVARCTVQLPRIFTASGGKTDESIRELEERNGRELPPSWQKSSYLKGELFLVLDEACSTEFLGHMLTYDEKYGLISEKCEKPE